MARTQRALMACLRWLDYCLSIGWRRDDLDFLEALWWEHHDDFGKIKP